MTKVSGGKYKPSGPAKIGLKLPFLGLPFDSPFRTSVTLRIELSLMKKNQYHQRTMGQNQVILRHKKFTSERVSESSGGREQSEQSGVS